MSEYIPSTDEVRLEYMAVRWAHSETASFEARAEFDRWLAKRDAEVAAKALTDAADELDSYDPSLGSDKMPPEGEWHVDIGYYGEANWLRARAAEYRKAVQPE